jgi:hypothetical protein
MRLIGGVLAGVIVLLLAVLFATSDSSLRDAVEARHADQWVATIGAKNRWRSSTGESKTRTFVLLPSFGIVSATEDRRGLHVNDADYDARNFALIFLAVLAVVLPAYLLVARRSSRRQVG